MSSVTSNQLDESMTQAAFCCFRGYTKTWVKIYLFKCFFKLFFLGKLSLVGRINLSIIEGTND